MTQKEANKSKSDPKIYLPLCPLAKLNPHSILVLPRTWVANVHHPLKKYLLEMEHWLFLPITFCVSLSMEFTISSFLFLRDLNLLRQTYPLLFTFLKICLFGPNRNSSSTQQNYQQALNSFKYKMLFSTLFNKLHCDPAL